MNGVHEYDYTICEDYDSVTLNGQEFARIVHVGRSYQVQPTVGSQAGTVFRTRGTHHTAFEDCMDYSYLEELPKKFGLEATE